jgi:hypothetical protein
MRRLHAYRQRRPAQQPRTKLLTLMWPCSDGGTAPRAPRLGRDALAEDSRHDRARPGFSEGMTTRVVVPAAAPGTLAANRLRRRFNDDELVITVDHNRHVPARSAVRPFGLTHVETSCDW